jgi:formate dehydrogenase subunit delta
MTPTAQVRMANDIARQFAHLGHDAAVAAIAEHLRLFWEPRMLAQLREVVAHGGGDLGPLARDAAVQVFAGQHR